MSKILVLYYSMYGHIELMSQAVAEGVRAAGSEATIKRVPETIPEAKAKEIGVKLEQKAPIANPDELGDYDGILFGGPTRYGVMAAQLRLLDRQAVALLRADRQARWRLLHHRHAAQRTRDHDHVLPHDLAAPRHGHRRPALFGEGADAPRRDYGRQPLRCQHHQRRRRFAHAERE